ncbi:TldD/PmbA family protein, partial [Oscillospiraceae bacterium OttesenSCG-928-G22]|nr:TldD/PmbA family protein [Oscillospiraceae bacterium OttesenSCG-928-G22]
MIADYLSPHRGRSSEHTELRAQVNINHSVSFLSGTLVTNSQLETAGVSARVYRNGVYGFASNAEYSADSVGAVLRAATDNAEFMDRHIGKGKPSILQHASGVRPLT